jgi:antitoxin component YwqK of YwqJK toxin-antitoxin module
MKKEIFVLLLCCGFLNAFAAPAKASKKPTASPASQGGVELDTVRTTLDDGSIARLYTVQKGTDIREGVAYTYHPNGNLAVEAPYKNGKLDGVFKSYYESGKVWQTIGYREGIEDGISTEFYENGIKKSREVYKMGVLDGASEVWSERGLLVRTLPYVNGQIHGVAKIYDDLGAIKEEMTFEKGLRNGPYRRFTKGVKTLEAIFENNRCVKNCDF